MTVEAGTLDPAIVAQNATCPNCGQPLASHSCPAVVIVSQEAGKMVTRSGAILHYGRGGGQACPHCGFAHNTHDNARLIAFRCLWSQFSRAELGNATQYGGELTIEHVQKFARWWKVNGATVQFNDGGRTGRKRPVAATPPASTSPSIAVPPSATPATTVPTDEAVDVRHVRGGPTIIAPAGEGDAAISAYQEAAKVVAEADAAEAVVDEAAASAALKQLRKQRRG